MIKNEIPVRRNDLSLTLNSPQKIAGVNYTSFARVGIENLQPWARGYDATSHRGRNILGCNFLFENLQLVCAWKINICLKTEHQRQSCRKKKREIVSVWEFVIKETQNKPKNFFFSCHISEISVYHRVGKQLSLWRSKRPKICTSGFPKE